MATPAIALSWLEYLLKRAPRPAAASPWRGELFRLRRDPTFDPGDLRASRASCTSQASMSRVALDAARETFGAAGRPVKASSQSPAVLTALAHRPGGLRACLPPLRDRPLPGRRAAAPDGRLLRSRLESTTTPPGPSVSVEWQGIPGRWDVAGGGPGGRLRCRYIPGGSGSTSTPV